MAQGPMSTEDQISEEELEAMVREAVAAGRIGFRCCFCYGLIEGDVCALITVTKWNGPEDGQRHKQWLCHAECFANSIDESVDVLETGV